MASKKTGLVKADKVNVLAKPKKAKVAKKAKKPKK